MSLSATDFEGPLNNECNKRYRKVCSEFEFSAAIAEQVKKITQNNFEPKTSSKKPTAIAP